MKINNSKKAWNVFKNSITILFIVFIINYYNVKNGYYENQINKETKITAENIKLFEEDIKNNNYIDIKNYNDKNYEDTNNIISKIGYKTSSIIENVMTKRTSDLIDFLKKLFT